MMRHLVLMLEPFRPEFLGVLSPSVSITMKLRNQHRNSVFRRDREFPANDCIMQFALHEATLVLGMILKYFTLIDHENYELDIKQTLTLKPGDFHIRVQSRHQAMRRRNQHKNSVFRRDREFPANDCIFFWIKAESRSCRP